MWVMALVADQKFSTFQDGGTVVIGDIVVGLRDGINTKFDFDSGVTTIQGTLNQVLVNNSVGVPVAGPVVLSTPQDIATTSSPTFASLTLTSPLTGANGGTGVVNTGLTINLGTPTTGYVLTSDVSGNATWQSVTASGAITTIQGNSGTATPAAGIVSILGGTTGLTTSGSGSTLSLTGTLVVANGGTGLSALTAYTLLAGGTTATGVMQQLPAGTASQLLKSNGAGALPGWTDASTVAVTSITGTANQVLVNGTSGVATNGNVTLTTPQDIATTSSPTFAALTLTSPLTVPNGGSGRNTATAYALLAGGTTATGIQQSLGTGTAGQLLQSNGASALPTWTTATFPSGSGTLNHMLRSDGTNWVQTTSTTLNSSDAMAGLSQVTSGSTTSPGAGVQLQAVGPIGSSGISAVYSYNNVTNFANFFAYKSASATVGVFSAVTSSEPLGNFHCWGDDGTQFTSACSIRGTVNGTVSNGVVPGRWQFLTNNASGVSTLGMTLDSSQVLTLVNPLLVASGGSGRASSTAYALIAGGTTSTGTQQSLTTGSSGQFLISGGAAALPTWTTATFPATAGTTGTILRSNGTNWVNSTATFADTYTASNLLYSNGANTVTGLATANNGVLITSAGGVPSISSTLPSGIAATSMNLTTPTLGVASATSINFGGAALSTYSGLTAWTPVFTFSTPGDLSVAYTAQSGQYSRIGNIVIAIFTLNCTPTFTTASGAFQITGLPFASNVAAGNNAIGSVVESAVIYPAARTVLNIYLSPNSQIINMYASGTAAAVTQITTANFTTGVAVLINGSITYMV